MTDMPRHDPLDPSPTNRAPAREVVTDADGEVQPQPEVEPLPPGQGEHVVHGTGPMGNR